MPANPNATWTELLLVSQSVIQGLPLVYGPNGATLPSAQTYIFKFPADQFRLPQGLVIYPCVILAPGGTSPMEDVDDPEQTFEDTVMIYPILAALLFATNRTYALNNDILYWRQQIITAFIDEPAALYTAMNTNITDVNQWDCRLEPAPWINPEIFLEQGLDASLFNLTFRTSRDRGRS